ncbi:MAG: ATP-binding protein [Bdellovibrionota bacterium]
MIDRALLKQSIDEWMNFYRRQRGSLIKRTAPTLPTKDIASAIIGVRRSGKTSIAIESDSEQLSQNVFYYNFEDPLFYAGADLNNLDSLISIASEYSENKIKHLILDEIQNVDGWERWLRKIIDQKQFRVTVTGSSAKLLSSEIATSLTGRTIQSTIWPLSFKEFLKFKGNNSCDRLDLLNSFREFMTHGGFPEVVLSDDLNFKKRLLRQYLNDITHKDIVNRYSIRNKKVLDSIILYYISNISSLHSYTSLNKAFGADVETISDYTQALEDSFLIFELSRFHRNLKVQKRDSRKIYCVDTGMRNASSRSLSDDTGKLLENIVYIELRRNELDIYYYKGEKEVDFLVTENMKPIKAIQVCALEMQTEKTRDREISALMECLTEFSLKEGLIITLDHEEKIELGSKTIWCVPAYKWLS